MATNRDKAFAAERRYKAKHRARINARMAAKRLDPVFRQREAEQAERYRDRNRAKVGTASAKWLRSHPEKVRAYAAHRRALKARQLCTCCERTAVDAVFNSAPPGFEVDHKIALRLGGLHCLHNLQVLTEAAHLEKTKQDIKLIADVRWLERSILWPP